MSKLEQQLALGRRRLFVEAAAGPIEMAEVSNPDSFEPVHDVKPVIDELRKKAAAVDAKTGKRGRPPKADKAEPWVAEGISRRTWYNRRKENKP